MDISYKPVSAYVGDAIPYYEDGRYYVYYLNDPRCMEKGVYAEKTTWNLVVTENGVTYEERGRVLPLGDEKKAYLNNYTGSVIKGKDNLYYAFFTAFNAENEKYCHEGKPVQSVMIARGDKPDKLEIIESSRFTGDDDIYEVYDWRDPYVFYNEEEKNYWMLLCARVKGTGYHRGGCIALCKSEDLINWAYCHPFYEPNMYITMECPEVFRMGSWWYLVFSTFSDRFLTHYRKSKSLLGPWLIPYEDSLDARSDYAIKTAGTDSERMAFGWVATKIGDKDNSDWEWGGTLISHRLTHDEESGDLKISITPSLDNLFSKEKEIEFDTSINIRREGSSFSSDGLGALLYSNTNDSFKLKVSLTSDAKEFGFFLGTDNKLENGYQLRFSHGALALDRWPRVEKEREGIYQWQIRGDIPYLIETTRYFDSSIRNFDITLVRNSGILVVYVNDSIVMSTRLYNKAEGFDGLYVIGGKLDISGFSYNVQ